MIADPRSADPKFTCDTEASSVVSLCFGLPPFRVEARLHLSGYCVILKEKTQRKETETALRISVNHTARFRACRSDSKHIPLHPAGRTLPFALQKTGGKRTLWLFLLPSFDLVTLFGIKPEQLNVLLSVRNWTALRSPDLKHLG